jgi:hypothetical protein
MTEDFERLTAYGKAFCGLTPAKEAVLIEVGDIVKPHLHTVTEDFYESLQTIPDAAVFLEGRVEQLKKTHIVWMGSLFTGPFDKDFTAAMFKVCDVHVRVKLPTEFMIGAITLINSRLYILVVDLFEDDKQRCAELLAAINAVTGFTLFIMEMYFRESNIAEELERFLKISGMSRTLFTNLAMAYRD